MKAAADRGAALKRSALTVGEFVRGVWLPLSDAKVARGQIKTTTAGHYRILVDKYVLPALETVRLRNLKPAHLRTLYANLTSRGLSSKSVRNLHVLISNALSLAVADGYLQCNVAKGRDVAPAARSAEMKVWTRKRGASHQSDRGGRACARRIDRVWTLEAARATAGVLHDPDDFRFDRDAVIGDDGMPDAAKLCAAAEALAKDKPHLAAKRTTVDVGQGPHGTTRDRVEDFASLLREAAR
jgi:hypothetical protein